MYSPLHKQGYATIWLRSKQSLPSPQQSHKVRYSGALGSMYGYFHPPRGELCRDLRQQAAIATLGRPLVLLQVKWSCLLLLKVLAPRLFQSYSAPLRYKQRLKLIRGFQDEHFCSPSLLLHKIVLKMSNPCPSRSAKPSPLLLAPLSGTVTIVLPSYTSVACLDSSVNR